MKPRWLFWTPDAGYADIITHRETSCTLFVRCISLIVWHPEPFCVISGGTGWRITLNRFRAAQNRKPDIQRENWRAKWGKQGVIWFKKNLLYVWLTCMRTDERAYVGAYTKLTVIAVVTIILTTITIETDAVGAFCIWSSFWWAYIQFVTSGS